MKCIAGGVNLYVHHHVFITNDIFFYYQQSMGELKQAHLNPSQFLTTWLFDWEDMFDHLNFFKKDNMIYWSSLGTLVHTKLMTLFNIFTMGTEYMNIIFYNFLYFVGQLALYKSFYQLKPEKKWLLIITVFLIPSVIFWCSGIHKDGLVLSCIGFICYYTLQFLKTNHTRLLVVIGLLLILLLMVRYFYFLCLMPAWILWVFSSKMQHKWLVFAGAYLIFFVVFFNMYRFSATNPLSLIANRQEEYFLVRGYSDMATPKLENNFESYLKNLPSALDHIFLRPYFKWTDPMKYKASALDTVLVWSLLLFCIVYLKRKNLKEGYYIFQIFFCGVVLIFIGYTVPNCGALVRYKSEFVAMLLPTLICMAEFPSFKKKEIQMPSG